jgi:saccharopine dehydrogenase-like NADP-dependent oxidoreductase
MKQILIVGAGLVSPPLIEYLLAVPDFAVTVAALNHSDAERLVGSHPRGRSVALDVQDAKAVDKLVSAADVVVSLLPAPLTPIVARAVLDHRKSLINTSYVSPEMWELDDEARRRGVLLLCEIGLDPGIDHMSAAQVIDRVQANAGTITHFSSSCGGLPAVESNTNPWGYKFSWSPRGVVLAGKNGARYLREGNIIEIPGPELFSHPWPYIVENAPGPFEIYPNRDATSYIDKYHLTGIRNMFRGTIRYHGWCRTMRVASDLGLLDTDTRSWPERTRFVDVTMQRIPQGTGSNADRIADFVQIERDGEVMARLEWAGLLSDRLLPNASFAPVDFFADRLLRLMAYKPGERDLVVLRHELAVVYETGLHEQITASLVDRGIPYGHSSMARTVSLPAAIATRLQAQGFLDLVGVQVPVSREIYGPVLSELAHLGIAIDEVHRAYYPGPFDT